MIRFSFDFAKETPDELEMSKADLMCSVADSKPENGWLLVKNLRTDFEGYVPYSYLRRIEHIEQQPYTMDFCLIVFISFYFPSFELSSNCKCWRGEQVVF